MLLQLFFFSPFFSLHPASHLQPAFFPPYFMSMGCTYKFFGFSISHTVLNLPLSILYLPFMFLIPCTISPILPLPLSTDKPSCDLYFCELFDSSCFGSLLNLLLFFQVQLLSCEFVVILLFIFLIFFFFLR